MKSNLIRILFLILITLSFQGCIVGTVVSVPFKIVGETVNVVAPDVVGDTISTTGDIIDMAIPF